MYSKLMKTTGLAAAFMGTVSAGAMAATLFVPQNGGVVVANELFGSSIVAPIPANDSVRIESSGVNTFTDSIMRVKFDLTGGATFATAVVPGNLTGDAATGFNAAVPCAVVPSVTVFAGGTVGASSVTFEVSNASSCRALRLTLAGGLQGIAQDSTVSIAASLKTQDGTNVDGGVINSPLVYITQVDANKGSASATSSVIDLSNSSKTLIPSFPVTDGINFVAGLMVDTLSTTAKTIDLSTAWDYTNNGGAAVITLSGIPSAVVAPPVLHLRSSSADLFGLSGITVACSAPSLAGTSTCNLNNGNMQTLTAIGANAGKIAALFTVNGTTVIPPSAIKAKMVVNYTASGPYQPIASEVKFDGATIANLGLNACAVEFATVFGNQTTGGSLSTIRLTNTSERAGKVYVAASSDAGVQTAAVALTNASPFSAIGNGGTVLNSSGELGSGATLEVLGKDIETILGQSFASWGTANRGRVRMYLETAANPAPGGAGSLHQNNNFQKAGCIAEAFMCFNGSCNVVQQTAAGVDNQTTGPQNK